MKKIAIIFTGGTIGMHNDKEINATIPALKGDDIMKMVPGIYTYASIEIVDFSQLPGPHMHPSKMLDLSNRIDKLLTNDEVDGVVITHGTDSLEETAYFLELTLSTSKPVVVTGSMQNISELSWDGPSNLTASIFTAISDYAHNKGVLVVMNNEIHTATEVIKTHTSSLNTFQSPNFGPLGIVDHEKAIFYHSIVRSQHILINKIEDKVGLVKCAVGMDDQVLRFLIDQGVKGIVLEGMGRGNIPPDMMSGIQYAVEKKVPIVLVSRCLKGQVWDSYGYPGGGKTLTDLGVILGSNLPGQKARIKLMIALSKTKDHQEIKEIFERDYYIEN